jgi:nucleotide-binding universal stress UspA family protein
MNPKRILCASHGTEGARAAEKQALLYCNRNVTLHHLIVVPDLWQGMMGDDWLNNATSRIRFGEYVESQLDNEVMEVVERLATATEETGAKFSFESHLGKPAECLVEACQATDFDLIIIGSPRPKGKEGLKSRMNLKTLTEKINVPLLIVPHPCS